MGKNVGKVDAYIRFLLGVAFLLNIFALETGIIGTIVLLVLGLAMIITSFTGYCGLYTLLKIDTYTVKEETKEPAAPAHH